MTRLLIFVFISIILLSCRKGIHQEIAIKNLSLGNVYFLISENEILSNPDEMASIRPKTSAPDSLMDIAYFKDRETAEMIKESLYRNRIERDSLVTILSSESAGIFIDAVSIQRIINDRYKGKIHIFIIPEKILLLHPDNEIINNKLYQNFKTLTAGEIEDLKMIFVYP
ncbi:MAG: hypothetical protein KIT62_03105 [Cyclobacteriaceae bacterium]|nr:hypothetical protein [Cyclobacteriaceae bacterium]